MLVEDISTNKCFLQVRISHFLRFISICDLFTDFPSYIATVSIRRVRIQLPGWDRFSIHCLYDPSFKSRSDYRISWHFTVPLSPSRLLVLWGQQIYSIIRRYKIWDTDGVFIWDISTIQYNTTKYTTEWITHSIKKERKLYLRIRNWIVKFVGKVLWQRMKCSSFSK
jgi:hypothetical protein